MTETLRLSQVFIAGGTPSVTYVDRQAADRHQSLEDRIRSYLDVGYKALTITGPTKSGKTVLCRKVIPKDEGAWIEGGSIKSEDDFWVQVAERLGMQSVHSVTEANSNSMTGTFELNAQGKLPLIFETGGKGGVSASGANQKAVTTIAAYTLRAKALDGLMTSNTPLVVDDFHYIERELQRTIVRTLKSAIFDGLRVILIAVPHRAFDAVRSEREMTGRVDQLSIALWTNEELERIARQGFPTLNVNCSDTIVADFVKESQGSPHLMQEFCSKLCLENGVREQQLHTSQLSISNRNNFYKNIAASTSKPAFDLLARGPRNRTDRKTREFADGNTGDIYLAVLHALAACGAKSKMTYEDIRSSMRNILAEGVPQAHEIGRVLVQMSKIARDKIEGEAVLEWDEEESVLYIADPFFAFYLRWLA